MKKIVVVKDKMQDGYSYELSNLLGKNFDPEFKPELTPKEMLELGIFGGHYMTDCVNEFPSDWFTHAKMDPQKYNKNLNYFKVDASQSLEIWIKKGWIRAQDPRGWFQWYCRYFMGRRSVDDQRQIARWKAIKRHISQVRLNCRKGDLTCRPRQRQALLHWAYDSRKI